MNDYLTQLKEEYAKSYTYTGDINELDPVDWADVSDDIAEDLIEENAYLTERNKSLMTSFIGMTIVAIALLVLHFIG